MTLYLKYRPQILEDLDSESVRKTLKKIIASGKIPHSFLFAGPKGIGKTSAARILAKVINCEKPAKDGEPCNSCSQCKATINGSNMDVIELDAASNRGIDDVRTLKDNVILAPVGGKKKIYIIDEAHMLTSEASNAFLKTLEEPPDHVVFILATTNPEKLPETVRSRLTTIVFEKAKVEEIINKLLKVTKAEKIKTEKGALELIAKGADGSFRDAIKLLEQLASYSDVIGEKLVKEFISRNSVVTPEEFLKMLLQKNTTDCISKIENIATTGGSIRVFLDQLISHAHTEILAKGGIGVGNYLALVKLFYDAKKDMYVSPIEQLPLELAVIKWATPTEKINSPTQTKKEEPKVEIKKKDPEPLKEETSPSKPLPVGEKIDNNVWSKILENVRTRNTTIEALLRAAHPMGFDGKTLTLGVYYQFHKERLEIVQNKRTLEEVLCLIFGKSLVKVSYRLTERENPTPRPKMDTLTTPRDKDIIEAAKEIFGS